MTTDIKEQRIKNLKKTQERRKQEAKERVFQAIKYLQSINGKINFQTVAKQANVSVSYLYKYPELKQRIGELRSKQNSLPSTQLNKPSSKSQNKIIAQFKKTIQRLQSESEELKETNKALAGQVYRLHFLEEQVDRLEQQNDFLKKKLEEQNYNKEQSSQKVTSIASKRKSTSIIPNIPNSVQSELEGLGIELNSTLSKTMKCTDESIILNAIEALKYELTKKDILNPGGWLNLAIQEGWTKPETINQQSNKPEQKIVKATDKPQKEQVSLSQLKKLSNIFNKDE